MKHACIQRIHSWSCRTGYTWWEHSLPKHPLLKTKPCNKQHQKCLPAKRLGPASIVPVHGPLLHQTGSLRHDCGAPSPDMSDHMGSAIGKGSSNRFAASGLESRYFWPGTPVTLILFCLHLFQTQIHIYIYNLIYCIILLYVFFVI